jgi:pimeloyl-ACP methyl ester carboxylesterase
LSWGHTFWCTEHGIPEKNSNGKELEPVATPIRAAGHPVHTPTIKGNRAGDPKTVRLDEAIQSIADYLNENNLKDIVLLGHSYDGMIITGVADRVPDRIRRLVYWNAFGPNNGECLNDMVPPHYVGLFDSIAAQRGDGSVVLPFPIWREAFINDADLETAKRAYDVLNPHPVKTFTDKISIRTNRRMGMQGNRTSTARKIFHCRTTIRGIRGCPRS